MQADAAIVLHPNFETAIAKIQDGRANELTVQQKPAVEFLKQNAAAENSEDDYSQLSLADRALKRRRIDQQESATYMDTRFLQPTSNMVERLNSQAKYAIRSKEEREFFRIF